MKRKVMAFSLTIFFVCSGIMTCNFFASHHVEKVDKVTITIEKGYEDMELVEDSMLTDNGVKLEADEIEVRYI